MSDPSEKPTTGTSFLLRMYWMFGGNILIMFLAVFITEQKGDAFTSRDILYWLAVGSVIAARFIDVRFMNGQTGEGAPATMKHWERYSMVLGAAAILAWIACHLVLSTHG